MKRVLAFLSALLIAASALAGPFAITASGQTFVGSVAYATLVANTPCTAARDGQLAYATDWGANGAQVYCKGSITRWLPANGQVVLKRMGAAVSGIANTETIAAQVQMPIGALQAGDKIVVDYAVTKSGTTDNLQTSFHWGTAGTIADTALTSWANFTVLGATQQSGGFVAPVRVLSTTSAVKLGGNNAQSSPYGGPGTGVAAVTTSGLADASSNAIWLSFGLRSSSTTDTVGVQEVTITHFAG